MNFEDLKKINEDKLNSYIGKLNTSRKPLNDSEIASLNKEIDIHKKIKNLLEKEPALFFKLKMEDALKILSKLVDDKDLKATYVSMVEPQKYEELRKKFKI